MVEHALAFSEADLRARGFEGFKRFHDLDLSQVPREPGVYAVLRGFYSNHEVLAASVGGWFKGKDPTGDPSTLKPLLGCHSETLYIGKADAGTRGTRGLRNGSLSLPGSARARPSATGAGGTSGSCRIPRICASRGFRCPTDPPRKLKASCSRNSSKFTDSCPLPTCVDSR